MTAMRAVKVEEETKEARANEAIRRKEDKVCQALSRVLLH